MAMTVLIVDDHASFRRAARALLELEGYAVVGRRGKRAGRGRGRA
jgi:DNA-binding NarL/FixJ family response regulator